MKRAALALAAANLAAPIVYLTLLALAKAAEHETIPRDAPHALATFGAILFIAVVIGWRLVLLFVLPASAALALLGWWAGWRSRRVFVGGGAALGFALPTGLLLAGAPDDASGALSSGLVGAGTGVVCGWVYWAILKPGRPRAITGEA